MCSDYDIDNLAADSYIWSFILFTEYLIKGTLKVGFLELQIRGVIAKIILLISGQKNIYCDPLFI